MQEDRHTIGTRNEIIVPDLFALTPKQMRKAWVRFMGDCDDWDEAGWEQAQFVLMSIETLVLNEGTTGESFARRNLERQLASLKGG